MVRGELWGGEEGGGKETIGQGIEGTMLWSRIGLTLAGTCEGRNLIASRGSRTALEFYLGVERDGRSRVDGWGCRSEQRPTFPGLLSCFACI